MNPYINVIANRLSLRSAKSGETRKNRLTRTPNFV